MIDKLLGGRYEIIEQVGGGGMALVYKAKCQLLNRYVAIKVLRDEYVEDEDFVNKFRMESQAAASLSHPNIVNIYDVGIDTVDNRRVNYIVMEFVDGKTLKEIIKHRGKLSLDEAINYSIQIARALQAAHRNKIIHRDIKPQNIMVDKTGRVKVMDFGIARAATSSTLASNTEVLGSVHYFSPEQAKGRYTDEKSDIYSLGIVMYEMMTGTIPYKGQSPVTIALKHMQEDITPPSRINPNIPKDFERVILKCVEKRQPDRYKNMEELLFDLSKIARRNRINMDLISVVDTSSDKNLDSTMKVPNLDEKLVKKKKLPKKPPKDKRERRRGAFAIFLGIISAFLLTFFIFILGPKFKNSLKVEEIIMPELVGKAELEAQEEIEGLGLKFEVLKRVESPDFEEGTVVKQETVSGTKLKQGFPVQVTVSAGQGNTTVPNLRGKNIFEAEGILREKGLSLGKTTYEASELHDLDSVIDQSILPSEKVSVGTKIDIVVSQGNIKKVDKVSVPRIINLNLEEARTILEKNNLKLGNITKENSVVPKDRVLWQSEVSGSEVAEGTTINVNISTGDLDKPEKPKEEPKEEKPKEEPKEEEKLTTFTLEIKENNTRVEIKRVQDGESKTVYDSRHDEGYASIPVTGKEAASFEVYINGVLQ